MNKSNVLKFEFSRWRIFKQAFFVYSWFLGCLFINFYMLLDSGNKLISLNTWLIILLVNIPFLLINIPCFIIHKNYLKYSRYHIFTFSNDKITLESKLGKSTIDILSIEKINISETSKLTRLPWSEYSWVEIIDKNDDVIKVCSYLAPIDLICEKILSYNSDIQITTKPTIASRDNWLSVFDFSFPIIK